MNKKKEDDPHSFKTRLLRSIFLGFIMILKILRLPSSWFSPKTRKIKDNWTLSMLWAFVSSLGKKAFMDQPCTYKVATDESKALVEPQYQLSPEQIMEFHEKGFLGPLDAIPESEMAIFRQQIEKELELESKAFGIKSVRDRHIDAPFIQDLFSHKNITEVLAQLLGPDILLWRSQVFNQMPGAPPIVWHQSSTYMHEDYKQPILKPQNINELFQLTVWVAVDNATEENGCLQFIPGSHDKIRKVKMNGKNSFYKARFDMDMDVQPSDIVSMPLRPGQFVVFSERCVHGSPGNRSKNSRRMGINFRAITPSTAVYTDQKKHYAAHLDTTWDLKNWGVIKLRGEDKYKLNKYIEVEQNELVEN